MGYKKKSVWEITCEACGKKVETKRQDNPYSYGSPTAPSGLPTGWVDISVTKNPSTGRVDPPVCSKECAVKYVEKRYDELSKPKKAPAKKPTAKKSTARKTTARKSTAYRRRPVRRRNW